MCFRYEGCQVQGRMMVMGMIYVPGSQLSENEAKKANRLVCRQLTACIPHIPTPSAYI